ncbi:MAG: hypothetical protein A2987_01120 [Omnitrophica bacterium RIFCSPLOWO2_01_FULL_45_10]|nr:MAG: hypothetical protein A2987_01120 [Omnitrophica bacterium RIFCSPLOWO2_01_FULL_45_10]
MKYADLHVHTFYSDSTLSPEEVVHTAKEKGLAAIAICDHDSIDGIEPCEQVGARLGVEIIPAIEVTAEKPEVEIHVLGYFIDWKKDWFQKKLKEIQEWRVGRVYKMVDKLKDCNIKLDPKEIFNLAGKGSVGRLHVARAILKAGKVKTLKEAFDKYIGFLKPCYVLDIRFSPQEAIDIILKVGGIPVLAHPYIIGNDTYIEEFITYGLKGIEVYHIEHKNSVVKRYESIARQHNLLMTGGSDCHGLGKGRILMGSVKVPYELVDKLRDEAKALKENRGI